MSTSANGDAEQRTPANGAADTVPWSSGSWSNEPASVTPDGDELIVEAVEGSDAWRRTAYGFTHDSEHALLQELPAGSAVEVEFDATSLREQFDQAGVFLFADAEHWVKAGLERSDGVLGTGAVVTVGRSDWSVGAVPEWSEQRVTVRVSRLQDAVVVRARSAQEREFRLLRVAPFPVERPLRAGPFLAAPSRPGLRVRFTAWRLDAEDAELHP